MKSFTRRSKCGFDVSSYSVNILKKVTRIKLRFKSTREFFAFENDNNVWRAQNRFRFLYLGFIDSYLLFLYEK